jgi:hypothetical protein
VVRWDSGTVWYAPCIYAFIWVGVGREQEVRSRTLIPSKTRPVHFCIYLGRGSGGVRK